MAEEARARGARVSEVRLVGVSKRFGQTVAVDRIDIRVPEGSILTLLGPSGCGKTTTLRMVAGLERPTEGHIYIGSECVSGDGRFVPPERRAIGMVFQSYAVWPHLTVFDNVAFPLRIRRRPRAEVHARTLDTLRLVQLASLADRLPAQLSGGQQQRVALARAIVFDPRLLLLDEPLSNLDAKLREYMRVEIRDLQRRLGVTTLYVTHDQHEALALSDLVAVMNEGRIVQLGSPQDIYERPATRFVADFVGWTNFLPGVVRDARTVEVSGRLLQCAVPAAVGPGTAVHVAVRPEDVQVLGDGARTGDNVLAARVKSALYAGKHALCELVVEDQPVFARVPAGMPVPSDAPVMLRLEPAGIRILAA
jgi:iron(III) transport system ATP-binding protein